MRPSPIRVACGRRQNVDAALLSDLNPDYATGCQDGEALKWALIKTALRVSHHVDPSRNLGKLHRVMTVLSRTASRGSQKHFGGVCSRGSNTRGGRTMIKEGHG